MRPLSFLPPSKITWLEQPSGVSVTLEDHLGCEFSKGQRSDAVLPHQHLLPHSVSQLYRHHRPSSPPTPAVFLLSVLWRSPEPLWGAACFSLILSRLARAGPAMFFLNWRNVNSPHEITPTLCVCVCVCEHVRRHCCTAAILSERLLLAECPLIELVLILQLHSAF